MSEEKKEGIHVDPQPNPYPYKPVEQRLVDLELAQEAILRRLDALEKASRV